jgi:vacuolar-type H+-ATPase subunit F/Vma7
MTAAIYLGDAVSAVGWRLAGAQVHLPAPGEEAVALETARAHGALVLLSAAVAAAIDETTLRKAQSALSPLVLVVPDMQGHVPLPDLALRWHAQLGLET